MALPHLGTHTVPAGIQVTAGGILGWIGGFALIETLDVNAIVLGCLTSMTTITVTFFGLRQRKLDRKAEANEQATVDQAAKVTATQKLIDQLQEQVGANMTAHLHEREANMRIREAAANKDLRVLELEFAVRQLHAQVVGLGATPVWKPEERTLRSKPADPQ